MSDQKGPESSWKWTAQREEAAFLAALDTESDEIIAARVGLSRSGLKRWKARPEFVERVKAIREEMGKAMLTRGIADRLRRLDAYQDVWERMQRLLDARGEALALVKDAPGGETGLLVRQFKQVGKDDYREEYLFDAALVREYRAVMEQAAREAGQWKERFSLDEADLDDLIERELATLAHRRQAATAGEAEGE